MSKLIKELSCQYERQLLNNATVTSKHEKALVKQKKIICNLSAAISELVKI